MFLNFINCLVFLCNILFLVIRCPKRCMSLGVYVSGKLGVIKSIELEFQK